MAKRYYLSTIIQVQRGIGLVYVPALSELGLNYVAEIKSGPDGAPILPWALRLVSGNKHGLIIADNRNMALPDVSLDMKLSAMASNARAKFKTDVESRGIDAAFINTADGYRDTIRAIGLLHNPNFNENNFDVSE